MTIPNSVILIWTGSNATIPSGWVRETGLDGKFPKGSGDSVAPNQTGGVATHGHTSPTHLHAITSHTHTYTLSEVGDTPNRGTKTLVENVEHNHYHETSTSGAPSGNSGSTEVTYSAVSNNPPNRKVIFIKSNGGSLTTDIAALWIESDTAPTNWSKVTELADRYLLGSSTGADADLTTDGGSSANAHTYNHSHSTAAHTHAAANSIHSKFYGDGRRNGNRGACVSNSHLHSIAFNSSNQNVNDYTSTPAAQSEVVEPAYQRMHLIKKGASGIKERGIIGMWLRPISEIPSGWSLVEEMKDKHCKIGNPVSSPTGGSNTHAHAGQGHVHTGNGSHTHTTGNAAHSNTANYDDGDGSEGVLFASSSNDHIVQNISSVVANFDSTNITADSSSNEPEYRTVAFIKFEKEVGGSLAFLFDQLI